MRALVIGADGFAGRWLLRHLAEAGDEVAAAVGPRYRPPLESAGTIAQLDVRDAEAVSTVVADTRPDVVYDLAGVSSRADREDVDAAVGVSVVGGMNALIACGRLDPAPRLLFVSTGYVYRPAEEALDEDSALGPTSLYAAAKLAAERSLLILAPALGVEVLIARPFNHTGPGQSESFVVPTVARQVAEIASGKQKPVEVADPSAARDFSDVRDVVAAYRVIAHRGLAGGVYNIASGNVTSVAEVARLMGEVAGASVSVRHLEGVAPPDGPRVLRGNAARLRGLGWRPQFPLAQTLADVLASAQVSSH